MVFLVIVSAILRLAVALAEKYERRARDWLKKHGVRVEFRVTEISLTRSSSGWRAEVKVSADAPWDSIIGGYIEKNVNRELGRALRP